MSYIINKGTEIPMVEMELSQPNGDEKRKENFLILIRLNAALMVALLHVAIIGKATIPAIRINM